MSIDLGYKDSNKKAEERIDILISQMTLEEKVAQLGCVMASNGDINGVKEKLKNGTGSFSFLSISMSGDTQKDYDYLHEVQRFLVEETRLGIPAIVHSEGIAGALIPGATSFPQSIGLAATFNENLAYKTGYAVKNQLKAFGFNCVNSPLFDLGREPRWGRISETYGENPYLVARMGTSYVLGVQKDGDMIATAKHFIGYGCAEGGRNGGEQQMSLRRMYDVYGFPFEAAIREGHVKSVMNSYGYLNDEPVVSSKFLLDDVLRRKLGFHDGLLVSDYGSLSHLKVRYNVCSTYAEAAIAALTAGMDIEQPQPVCYETLIDSVAEGKIDISYIDTAVKRVLKAKFESGLFENPYGTGNFEAMTNNRLFVLSKQIATKSIVLTKNDNVLPIKHGTKIAVIGPSADNKRVLFGGYTPVALSMASSSDMDKSQEDIYLEQMCKAMIAEHKESLTKSGLIFDDEPSPEQKQVIYGIIKKYMPKYSAQGVGTVEEFIDKHYPKCKSVKQTLCECYGEDNVIYAQGCTTRKFVEGGIDEAVSAAERSDVVVAVIGGKEGMCDADATCGENKDNPNIGLEPCQTELMQALFRTGKPVVAVILDGRAVSVPELQETCSAILYAWLPGEAGAYAIADVLSGKENPSGKMPFTILKTVEQVPMYCGSTSFLVGRDDLADFVDADKNTPLYEFGYGLSYTNFEYSDLQVDAEVVAGDKISIGFHIKNTGDYDGEEAVQIYVRDMVSSIPRPSLILAGIANVKLEKGQQKSVTALLDTRLLSFHDAAMKNVIEPGDIMVYIGSSSKDIRLKAKCKIIGEKVTCKKVFKTQISVK